MRSYIAFTLAAFASANEIKARFMQFIIEFGKNFGTFEEFEFRFA